MFGFPFPDMQIHGTGTSQPPQLTVTDLALMWGRAESVQDQQIRTDLFRLLTAVESRTVVESEAHRRKGQESGLAAVADCFEAAYDTGDAPA